MVGLGSVVVGSGSYVGSDAGSGTGLGTAVRRHLRARLRAGGCLLVVHVQPRWVASGQRDGGHGVAAVRAQARGRQAHPGWRARPRHLLRRSHPPLTTCGRGRRPAAPHASTAPTPL